MQPGVFVIVCLRGRREDMGLQWQQSVKQELESMMASRSVRAVLQQRRRAPLLHLEFPVVTGAQADDVAGALDKLVEALRTMLGVDPATEVGGRAAGTEKEGRKGGRTGGLGGGRGATRQTLGLGEVTLTPWLGSVSEVGSRTKAVVGWIMLMGVRRCFVLVVEQVDGDLLAEEGQAVRPITRETATEQRPFAIQDAGKGEGPPPTAGCLCLRLTWPLPASRTCLGSGLGPVRADGDRGGAGGAPGAKDPGHRAGRVREGEPGRHARQAEAHR